MKRTANILLLLIFSASMVADTFHYWIGFADKKGSEYTIAQPGDFLSSRSLLRRERQGIAIDETDLPVSNLYLEAIKGVGATVVGTSRWMNGVSITVSDTAVVMPQIRALTFVREVELTQTLSEVAPSPKHSKKLQMELTAVCDSAMVQKRMLHADELNLLGYRGEGMHIAVIDAGFRNVDVIDGYDSLRNDGRLLGTRNFVDASASVYTQDVHGEAVLSTMAANVPGRMVGIAPKASYWLLVTEESSTESIFETDNWIRAVEFADSVGVDVVNTSLGYSTFDDEATSWTYADMNGVNTRISRAATVAARKGMLMVISAGNEGNKEWHYITAPADADSIVTVGAVDYVGVHAPFSSYGPSADGRVKPTFCAMGADASLMWTDGSVYQADGTSFSSPILAAAAACLWQACPQLNNMQLIELMRRSASLADSPNDALGYGIPNVMQAYTLHTALNKVNDANEVGVYPNPFAEKLLLRADNALAYKVFDACGRMMCDGRCSDTQTLDTSAWGRGVYLLRVESNKGVSIHKLIKR